jgi:fatty acid desaturase
MPDPAESAPITWYRTPVDRDLMRRLLERSDRKGAAITLGNLGLWALTGTAVVLAQDRLPWWAVVAIAFLHANLVAFAINAVHELGHGTVFRTKALNGVFERIFAFVGWVQPDLFDRSHARHHRYTLHKADDGEVVLPIRARPADFLKWGIVNWWAWRHIAGVVEIALGRFPGAWNQRLFPADQPGLRRAPRIWAWTLLLGHTAIVVVAILTGLWSLLLAVTFAAWWGTWFQCVVNWTQHIGLQDEVPDARRCCRTIILNPVVSFLYWHMEYHIERHMFAAVPCYNLARLHAAIAHDLPPCPVGLAAAWREICAIQDRQDREPGYQFDQFAQFAQFAQAVPA